MSVYIKIILTSRFLVAVFWTASLQSEQNEWSWTIIGKFALALALCWIFVNDLCDAISPKRPSDRLIAKERRTALDEHYELYPSSRPTADD
jgi:hypothetical protein